MAIQDPHGDTGAGPAAHRRNGTTDGPDAVSESAYESESESTGPDTPAERPASTGTGSRLATGLIGGTPSAARTQAVTAGPTGPQPPRGEAGSAAIAAHHATETETTTTTTAAPATPAPAAAEGSAPQVGTRTTGEPAGAGRGARPRGARALLFAAPATPATAEAPRPATASRAAPDGPDGTGEDDDSAGPARVSRPMAAAALMAGVLLIGTPFVIAALLPDDDSPARRPGAAGYVDRAAEPGGYVPSAAAETPGGPTPAAKNAKDTNETEDTKNGKGAEDGAKTGPEGAEGAALTDGGDGADGTTGSGPTAGPGGKATSGSTGKSGSEAAPDDKADTSGAATARATPKAAGPATYSALGGPHCSGDVTYRESGSSSQGDDGWTTHPGGYSNGCTGVFRSLPISGKSSDAGNSAYWIFRTGDVVRGTCKVSVHIPNDSKRTHVGGTPAYYTLHDATNGATALLASFTIDQPSHQGVWVAGPSVRVTQGILTLKLHDRGKEATSDARMAADAARINCTAN